MSYFKASIAIIITLISVHTVTVYAASSYEILKAVPHEEQPAIVAASMIEMLASKAYTQQPLDTKSIQEGLPESAQQHAVGFLQLTPEQQKELLAFWLVQSWLAQQNKLTEETKQSTRHLSPGSASSSQYVTTNIANTAENLPSDADKESGSFIKGLTLLTDLLNDIFTQKSTLKIAVLNSFHFLASRPEETRPAIIKVLVTSPMIHELVKNVSCIAHSTQCNNEWFTYHDSNIVIPFPNIPTNDSEIWATHMSQLAQIPHELQLLVLATWLVEQWISNVVDPAVIAQILEDEDEQGEELGEEWTDEEYDEEYSEDDQDILEDDITFE